MIAQQSMGGAPAPASDVAATLRFAMMSQASQTLSEVAQDLAATAEDAPMPCCIPLTRAAEGLEWLSGQLDNDTLTPRRVKAYADLARVECDELEAAGVPDPLDDIAEHLNSVRADLHALCVLYREPRRRRR